MPCIAASGRPLLVVSGSLLLKVLAVNGFFELQFFKLEIPACQSVSQSVIPAKSRAAGREPGSRKILYCLKRLVSDSS
jgi:hypothetical protein